MSIDRETAMKIAELSAIKVPEEELDDLALDLGKIIDFIEQLSEVNTDDVAPMTSVAKMTLPWRQDAVTDGGKRDDILLNAPERAEGFFVVPKVIE